MEYFTALFVIVGIYIILAVSFNLIIGYGGLISIAHPIFFALGAYVTAVLSLNTPLNPILAVILGGIFAALASIMLSLPSLRISGDYLLITSIGFQLGLLEIIKNIGFLGGASGLGGIPNVIENHRTLSFAIITGIVAFFVVFTVRALIKGPYGRAIQAMRDDELAFSAVGRRAMTMKIAIFALGSGFAGIAGGIYAYYYQYITPDQFMILQSAMILTMVVVGGMGSIYGPIVGAAILILLPEGITFLNLPSSVMASLQGILFSLLVILFLFLRPQGLVAANKNKAGNL